MRPARKKPYQDQTLILRIPLELDDDLDRNKMERLSWLCLLDEVLRVLPHNPLWESFFFDACSHIHDHHMDGKLQAYDIFELAHLELAPHFFFLHYVDVLKLHMRAHLIFFFNTYLLLKLRQFLLIATLKPTYGSSIAYGQLLQI